jgi:hypothetical protein
MRNIQTIRPLGKEAGGARRRQVDARTPSGYVQRISPSERGENVQREKKYSKIYGKKWTYWLIIIITIMTMIITMIIIIITASFLWPASGQTFQ